MSSDSLSCIICHGTDGPFVLTRVEGQVAGNEKDMHFLHGNSIHGRCALASLKYSPNCSLCGRKFTHFDGRSIVELAFAHSVFADLERAFGAFDSIASTVAHILVYSDRPDNLIPPLKEVLSENLAALKSALVPVPGALTDLARTLRIESSIVNRAHEAHISTHNAFDRVQGAIDWVLFHFDAVRTQVFVDQVDSTIIDLSRKLADVAVVLASADLALTTMVDRGLAEYALTHHSPGTRDLIHSLLTRAQVAIICADNAAVQANTVRFEAQGADHAVVQANTVRSEAQGNALSKSDLVEVLRAFDAQEIDLARQGLTDVLNFLETADRAFGVDAQIALAALKHSSAEKRLAFIRARTNRVARNHFGATFIEARRSCFAERNNNPPIRATRRATPNFFILSLIISCAICYLPTTYIYNKYFSGE